MNLKFFGLEAAPVVFMISILTLSIEFFSMFEFSVSGGAIFSIWFLFSSLFHIKHSAIIFLLVPLLYFIVNFIVQWDVIDELEFIKSFLLTIWFLFVCGVTFMGGYSINSLKQFKYFYISIIIIISGVEFIQILEQSIFHSHQSWFFLDRFSISTAETVGRFEAVFIPGYMRPISIFHEPSYLAFVLLLMLVLNIEVLKLRYINAILIISIVATFSSTIFFFSFVYLMVCFLDRSRFPYVIMLFGFLLFLVVLSMDILRLGEIFMPGTSGHERLVVPLNVTVRYLLEYPFGLALGQSEVMFNNSFYLFILYFGVLFPFVVIFLLLLLYNRIGFNLKLLRYVVVLFSLFFLSGALFTLEGAFFIFLINLIYIGEGGYSARIYHGR